MRPIVCWGARQNSVVILGIALRLHQRLAAAIGTVCEIRMFRSVSVEGFHGGFAERGHFVNRAVGEIDESFRVAERPGGVDPARCVAGVGARGCVALQDGQCQRAIIHFSGEPAIALAAKFAIPSGGGHPYFDLYVRIWRGFVVGGDAAKGGELLVEGGIAD